MITAEMRSAMDMVLKDADISEATRELVGRLLGGGEWVRLADARRVLGCSTARLARFCRSHPDVGRQVVSGRGGSLFNFPQLVAAWMAEEIEQAIEQAAVCE